jgi:hypothetical protein
MSPWATANAAASARDLPGVRSSMAEWDAVFAGVASIYGRCVVARSVVDDDHFITRCERLPRQVAQALVQQVMTVARRDDDADGHTRLPAVRILASQASRMYPPNHRTRRAAQILPDRSPPSTNPIAR